MIATPDHHLLISPAKKLQGVDPWQRVQCSDPAKKLQGVDPWQRVQCSESNRQDTGLRWTKGI